MKIFFAVILSLFSLNQAFTQEFDLVIDTIYTKFTKQGDNILLWNGSKSVKFANGEYEDYPIIQKGFNGYFGPPAVLKDGFLYPVDEKSNINEAYKAKIGKHLSHGGLHLKIKSDDLAYVRGDSVFVNNFKTNEEKFALYNGTNHGLNSRYIWIQREYPEEDYIYNFKDNILHKLPEDFAMPKTENAWLIVNHTYSFDGPERLRVLDTDLKEVLSFEDRFDHYSLLNDLAIFNGPVKRGQVYYKGKRLKFNYNMKIAYCYEKLNWCRFKTKEGKFGIIDNEGKIVFKPIYENIRVGILEDEVFVKASDHSFLIKDGKVVFQTDKADKIEHLVDNFFLKKKGYRQSVVDQNDNEVFNVSHIDFIEGQDVFGIPIFRGKNKKNLYFIWNLKGEIISQWEKEKEDVVVASYFGIKELNFKMYQNMEESYLKKINPSGLYIYNEKEKYKHIKSYLIDINQNKVSKDYDHIYQLDEQGNFLIQTLSKKYGVIKLVKN